jgi:hypothetical protein
VVSIYERCDAMSINTDFQGRLLVYIVKNSLQ